MFWNVLILMHSLMLVQNISHTIVKSMCMMILSGTRANGRHTLSAAQSGHE